MALAEALPLTGSATSATDSVLGVSCNDAFTFWGLPQQWRASLEEFNRPSADIADWYLYEYYLAPQERRPSSKLNNYYRIKQLIPLRLRFLLKSYFVRARRKRPFPAWPCEGALVDYWRAWMRKGVEILGVQDGYHIDFWPQGRKCCIVLTHDVESPKGMQLMERIADLEERWGFYSSWNIPLAQYPVDWKLVERLRARGFEFGAHGLSHDGRLFRSELDFQALAPRLEQLAREHNLRGFRSPSTLRVMPWIQSLDFDYDSSFADTDPYEPQPGGCCSIFPYFIGKMVELPYTLAQDHTLIHLLRRDPLPIWREKARWIASMGGMILALIHPDYCGEPPYLDTYQEFLKFLADFEHAWRALPSQVAAWWRCRASLRLTVGRNGPSIEGSRATQAQATLLSETPLFR